MYPNVDDTNFNSKESRRIGSINIWILSHGTTFHPVQILMFTYQLYIENGTVFCNSSVPHIQQGELLQHVCNLYSPKRLAYQTCYRT